MPQAPANALIPAPVTVRFGAGESRRFTTEFRIGRSPECGVCIVDTHVSRVHAEVVPAGSAWQIRDLGSSNGLYRDGQRVTEALIRNGTLIRLGADGPELSFELEPATVRTPISGAGEETIVARYAQRYFGDSPSEEPAGEHTMYVRRAFAHVQSKQRRRYTGVIVALIAVAIGVSVYALNLHREVMRERETARDIFYDMKSLDVQISALQASVAQTPNAQGTEALNSYEALRRQMEVKYDRYLENPHLQRPGMTEQQRLIVRVARIFGECDLDTPPDFEQEVERYIRYWQASGRYARDIRLAQEKGYTQTIPKELEAHGLPPQFFYLAMQESNFSSDVSGPVTRKGIAKGMWQFIPGTAVQYGLHLGPLTDVPKADPDDERDQFPKATRAAAEYIQTLYRTDAQASGLLVMACYNWGEFAVLPLVRSMPLNPHDRNFWRLLSQHRDQIPQQTYDYVFYITAAAVIGENPRLFGFDFDNPLAPEANNASSDHSAASTGSSVSSSARAGIGTAL